MQLSALLDTRRFLAGSQYSGNIQGIWISLWSLLWKISCSQLLIPKKTSFPFSETWKWLFVLRCTQALKREDTTTASSVMKSGSYMETISWRSMILWAKTYVGFLVCLASLGTKVTILYKLRHLNYFTLVWNLLWDLECLAFKRLEHSRSWSSHQLLSDSENEPLDYQEYNAVILVLKQ